MNCCQKASEGRVVRQLIQIKEANKVIVIVIESNNCCEVRIKEAYKRILKVATVSLL